MKTTAGACGVRGFEWPPMFAVAVSNCTPVLSSVCTVSHCGEPGGNKIKFLTAPVLLFCFVLMFSQTYSSPCNFTARQKTHKLLVSGTMDM